MAFTTGTATDYHDMLTDLKDYLVLQGWTLNNWTAPGSLTAHAQLDVTGPGIMGGQSPSISIYSDNVPATNSYGWQISAYPAYNGALAFGNQESNSPLPFFLLWANTIDYWFYVNDWRFIVVAKIGTYYLSMYAGFFLPYALPSEYHFPYYIGASYASLATYNTDTSGLRSFCDPGHGAAFYLRMDGADWGYITNHGNYANQTDGPAGNGSRGTIWPWRNPTCEYDNSTVEIFWSWLDEMRPLANGNIPMIQAHIIDAGDDTVAGVLDGVYGITGFGRASEQVIVAGAQDYRIFQNINRANNRHFFTIEEL